MEAGDLDGFRVRSVVKETGVDDGGLNEFGTEYFPHPTYKDQDRAFYHALGSGNISVGYNPFAIIKLIKDSMKMIKDLDIKSHNMKGEGDPNHFV